MIKKKIIVITAFVLVIALAVGSILMAVLKPGESSSPEEKNEHDELFVRELLDGCDISTIIDDPEWDANIVDSTSNYVMVEADKFDFSKQIGIEDGYTNIYYDEETHVIDMLQHNYVVYTNGTDSKAELQNLIGEMQGNLVGILGNPSESFMLINTVGELQNYDDLTLDEMIDKVLSGGYILYIMYENNGLRYEMNIMFSDDTIYSTAWVYDDAEFHGGVE